MSNLLAGRGCFQSKDLDAAQRVLLDLLRLDPDNAEARCNLEVLRGAARELGKAATAVRNQRSKRRP
jgi:hypothetical protein